MNAPAQGNGAATMFAPAERATDHELAAARQAFLSNRLAVTMLEAMAHPAAILNKERQVVAVNQRFLEAAGVCEDRSLLGQRPGEVVGCIHSTVAPGGCGTHEDCRTCGAVNAILGALETRGTAVREARLMTNGEADGGALDLEITASHMVLGDVELIVLALKDTSAEHRRRLLERVFFHDVMNTAGGLRGVAELLLAERDTTTETECKQFVYRLSGQIVDEITEHRQLLAAEHGDLLVSAELTLPAEIVDEVAGAYRHHHVAEHRRINVPTTTLQPLRTDPILLRRVLGNLVKNALEATPRDGTVTFSAEPFEDGVAFFVHNPSVMSADVRSQIFQRSFTTKGDPSRGVGTYSIRLLTERYLRGKVTFVSREPEGTTFTLLIPNLPPVLPAD